MSLKLRPGYVAGFLALLVVPFAIRAFFPSGEKYYLHLLIQIMLWAFMYTSWSLMGRFGLTSFGHSAFTGIGAYITVLLWNYAGITPLVGIPIAVVFATLAGLLVGYPCFSRKITGHYFALLTLAFTEFVRLCIVGLRDWTGGSLGTQPKRYGDGLSLWAVQFEPDRRIAYFIALGLWIFGLYVWTRVDRSMDRYALDAASQDEDAAASVGINVTREKLKITALSAGMSALGGAMFGQYQMYIGPDTIAGLSVSLNMVFAVIAGGMWTLFGPTFGAAFTQLLSESLRIMIQSEGFKAMLDGLNAVFARFSSFKINLTNALALDALIYGLLLVLFIIYMPRGILGTLIDRWQRRP